MSMSKEDFKNAFREVISAEFSHIPCEEDSIDYTFSERFNKKMNKLIKAQRKPYYFLINTTAKKVAVMFVIFATLITASMSVKAIREPVLEFFIEIFGTHDKYTAQGDTKNKIEKIYSITKLPNGFKEIDSVLIDTMNNVTYESEDGKVIIFTQTVTADLNIDVDNEQSNTIIKIFDDKKLYIKNIDEGITVLWVYDGYSFQINTFNIDDMDTILDMIKSIQ